MTSSFAGCESYKYKQFFWQFISYVMKDDYVNRKVKQKKSLILANASSWSMTMYIAEYDPGSLRNNKCKPQKNLID